MPYGIIKIDTVTFTDAGVDKSVSISGLVQNPTFSGNVTVTGTLSGVTVTGTTANFTSGNFTNISGGTHTITSGVFAAGSAASPSITFTGDLNTGIYSPGTDQVAISTGGSGRLFVDASGRLGIGTSSPASLLSVVKAAEGTSLEALRLVNESPNQRSTSSVYIGMYGSNEAYERARILCGNPTDFDGNNGFLSFWTRGSNTLSERLRITSAGLVGIGTSSPDVLLDAQAISGNAKIQAKETTTSKRIQLEANTAYHALYADGAVPVYHYSNGSIALTIDSSQRVGIGTTSPSYLLDVASSVAQVGNSTDAFIQYKSTAGNWHVGANSSNAYVFYSGTYGSGSEHARIDSSGRVGIGTSSPSYKLDVQGGVISAGNGTIYGGIGYSTRPEIGSLSNHDCGFMTNSTTRMLLDTSGRLGIGTTPDSRLHVQGLGSASGYTSAGNAGLKVDFGTSANGVINLVGGADLGIYRSNTSGAYDVGIGFGDNSNRILRFDTAGSERARIDSSGRLLVGTSSGRNIGTVYQHRLQIETTQYAGLSIVNNTADTGPALLVLAKSRGTSVGSVNLVQANDVLGSLTFAGADGTDIETPGASIEAFVDGTPGANDMPGRLVFSTTADGAASPTERMRITNSGDLLVDSTSSGARLTLRTATDGSGLGVYVNSNNATQRAIFVYSDAAVADTFRIYSNGNAVNTNSSYGAISDIKLKENIVDANSQWDDIKNLQVRNYNLKEGQAHRQIGLIAQEAELVSPGLVYETPDFDAEGNDLGTTTKVVQYSVLYMKAVKALQEAMERIETLEAKVAALENS